MTEPSGSDRREPQPSFQVRIPLEWDETVQVDTVYANQVLISHGGPEFSLVFGFVIPPLNTTELPDALRIEPQIRVVIARDAMPAIVQAMNENLRRYREGQMRPPAGGPGTPGGTHGGQPPRTPEAD